MQYLNLDNIARSTADVEYHPLLPFLPPQGRVLFLGSFPPQRKRWCMDFYYPNFLNDHWRIEGIVFFGDKDHFVDTRRKSFRLESIVEFLNDKGIGIFDTATAVRRLNDNASDKFLEVVEPTDIFALLDQMKQCRVIATTGEKATSTACAMLGVARIPPVGTYAVVPPSERLAQEEAAPYERVLYRLPSSSRAYPLSLEKKAAAYREMFSFAGLVE